jgi:hypothetical protein
MLRAALSLLACVLMASSLNAAITQSEHPGSVPILLGLDKVRAELKIDSLQKAVLDSIRSEYKAAVRKLADPMPVTPEQRVAAEKQLVALNERYNQRALSVLNDSQRKRFIQLEHHVLGATMLYSSKVQKKVGITPEQQKQIAGVLDSEKAYVAKINKQFEAGKISYQDRLELLRSKRLAQGTQLLKLLTPEQRDALSSLGGEKFAL